MGKGAAGARKEEAFEKLAGVEEMVNAQILDIEKVRLMHHPVKL